MLGNGIPEMGRVSMVVDTGLLAHSENDCRIINPAPMKPAVTTHNQKSLTFRLLEAM